MSIGHIHVNTINTMKTISNKNNWDKFKGDGIIKFKPIIKWSGSKRSQSEEIIKRFPKEIKTYYEPFVGGGSVLFQLLNSDIKVDKYVCSDINKDLIDLWNCIKYNPEELYVEYKLMHTELNNMSNVEDRKQYYYRIRKTFNETRNPYLFFFLSRTCANGLIRYNSKGNFNTSFHFSRPGINPETLKEILYEWSNLLNKYDVSFICQDYKTIKCNYDDLMYLDPPYANIKGVYFGQINYEEFWEYLRSIRGNYILSFDGKTGNKDMTYEVPNDVYDSHEYIYNGISGFGKIHKKQEYVNESLYIKFNKN